jgi:hypothetical protein
LDLPEGPSHQVVLARFDARKAGAYHATSALLLLVFALLIAWIGVRTAENGIDRAAILMACAVVVSIPLVARSLAGMFRLLGSRQALYVRGTRLVYLFPLIGQLRLQEIKAIDAVMDRRGFGLKPYLRVKGSSRALFVPLFQTAETAEEIRASILRQTNQAAPPSAP